MQFYSNLYAIIHILYTDDEHGNSLESTTEENRVALSKPNYRRVNKVKNIAIKTSEIFTSWKQTDYGQYCKEYQSVKNKNSKDIPFKIVKKIGPNFSVRKDRNWKYVSNRANTVKNMFDNFDNEFKKFIIEDHHISSNCNPSIINSKYLSVNEKVNLHLFQYSFRKMKVNNRTQSIDHWFSNNQESSYMQSLSIYQPNLKNIVSMTNWKSMSNILTPYFQDKSNSQYNLFSQNLLKK